MAFDYDTILNWPFDEIVQSYTTKDVILYALGIGLGFNPTDPEELQFVYEKELKTFPTMPVILGHPGPWLTNPATGIDMSRVLHGEQYLEVYKPLPAQGTIRAQTKITDVIDKGKEKGAIIITTREIRNDENGDLLCTQKAIIVARGNGGFGGPVTQAPQPHSIPDRPADTSVEIETSPQMALLYRLSGDYNPLHVDVKLAQKVGFTSPILHGLASYGVAARTVMRACQVSDPGQMKSFGLRFSSPVYPGETIRTEVWNDADTISFRSFVVERDKLVLNNGRAEFN